MKTIFILHGWAVRGAKANQKVWQPFVTELEENGLKVFFLKIPGLSAPLDEVWDLNDYVSWLSSEISSKSKNKKFALLGHSFGGQLATKYAVQNQDKVGKLILLDSAGIRDMAPRAIIKRKLFWIFAKLGKVVFKGEFFRNILYKLAKESDYKKASPLLRKTMAKVLDNQVLKDLPKLKIKTKIIWGENDKATPVKHAHKMHKMIEDSELAFIKGGRHSPQFTHTKETAKLVSDFVLKK